MVRRQADAQPLLRYATATDYAPIYRSIMDVFTEASAGYASRLRVEDVHAALLERATERDSSLADVPTLAEVGDRLKRLHEWGNLSQDNDTSRATNLDSYGAVAYVYDLTPGGEAAQEALSALEDGLRRVGGLQAVALRQIEELLDRFVELVGTGIDESTDGYSEAVYTCCEDLHNRFRGLTANAAMFMQKVNKLLTAPVVGGEEFALFKADTIAYLNDFLADLETTSADIRLRLDKLDKFGDDPLTRALAAGEHASGEFALMPSDDHPTWAAVTATRLAGVASWFRAGSEASTGSTVLYAKARDAILGITRVAERIRESVESPSSRAVDFLDLAVRFETCADDDVAHAVWHAVFGLAPARHFGSFLDTDVAATTSWWDPDARVVISKSLRVSGRTDYVRRAAQVRDRSAHKRYLATFATREQDRTTAAAEGLIGLGDVRVSDLNERFGGPLDPATLTLLARLLSRALRGRPRADGTRRATSLDGALSITIGEDLGRAASITATTGRWTMLDRFVCVERTSRVRTNERADADRRGPEPQPVRNPPAELHAPLAVGRPRPGAEQAK